MKLKSLDDLLAMQMKDLYSAEKQLTAALPKMAKKAASPELRQAFETHLEETRAQLDRLEQAAESLGINPKNHKCKAMEGMIEETEEMMRQDAEAHVLDAGLIANAQRVEHYEIAGYGCAAQFARQLGHERAAQLLEMTLKEEKNTDAKLTNIAEQSVNLKAEKQV